MQLKQIPGWPFYLASLVLILVSAVLGLIFSGSTSPRISPSFKAGNYFAMPLGERAPTQQATSKIWWIEHQASGRCSPFALEYRLPDDSAPENENVLPVASPDEAKALVRTAKDHGYEVASFRLLAEAGERNQLNDFPGGVIALGETGIRLEKGDKAAARGWLQAMRKLGRPSPGVALWAAVAMCRDAS